MTAPRFYIGRRRRIAAYTTLGLTGIICGAIAVSGLAVAYDIAPALAVSVIASAQVGFFAAVAISAIARGREVIVMTEKLLAALGAVALAAWIGGHSMEQSLDLAVVGIGVFLVSGRVGCSRAGCCYGRPARRGLTYGSDHVDAGFPAALAGVPLFPLQLVESALHAAVTALAIAAFDASRPGQAAVVFLAGYSVVRFATEPARGDHVRPYALGLSETQWLSLAILAALAVAAPVISFVAAAVGLVALAQISTRARRRHLSAQATFELASALDSMAAPTTAIQTIDTPRLVISRSLEGDALHVALSAQPPLATAEGQLLGEIVARLTGTDADVEVERSRSDGPVHIRLPRY